MHSNVTIKNVSWPHFSWPTLYITQQSKCCVCVTIVRNLENEQHFNLSLEGSKFNVTWRLVALTITCHSCMSLIV